jgi:hypothetical protein
MWSVGFKAKALGRNQHFEDKGPWKAKTLEGRGASKAKALRRQRRKHFEGTGPWNAKAEEAMA